MCKKIMLLLLFLVPFSWAMKKTDEEKVDIAYNLAKLAKDIGFSARECDEKIVYEPEKEIKEARDSLTSFKVVTFKNNKMIDGLTYFPSPCSFVHQPLYCCIFTRTPSDMPRKEAPTAYFQGLWRAFSEVLDKKNDLFGLFSFIVSYEDHVPELMEREPWVINQYEKSDALDLVKNFKLLYAANGFKKETLNIFGLALIDLCKKKKKDDTK